MASAIHWKVLLLNFPLSGDGGIFHIRFSRHSTTFVGTSFGSHFNQRHVAFVSPCQNCQGWIIWSGLRQMELIMQTGFSTAIFAISAFAKAMKNSILRCWLPSARLRSKCRAPDTAKSVHGGCAIIMSHPSSKCFKTSSWIWKAGSPSHGMISQLQASCPSLRKASRTVAEYSQATSILI